MVSPGFIDTHQHSFDIADGRLGAQDGTTTQLELEFGMRGMTVVLLLTAILVVDQQPSASDDDSATNDIVDDVMSHLGFGTQHRGALEAGEILFSGHPELEPLPQSVAVAGAMMLIGRPPGDLIDAYLSDETLRSHADIRAAGSLPDVGGDVGELAGLVFGEDEQGEVRRLLEAGAGSELNLAPDEIELISAIAHGDSASADAVTTYKDILWARLQAYRAEGLDGIPPYARQSGELASPAEELRASLETTALIEKYSPGLHAALLDYPGSMEEIDESRLLWMKKSVAKRPAVVLAHRMLVVDGDIAVVAEREFYVGHTYNSMLTIAAVVPHEGGSLIFATNRTFTEKVRGAKIRKTVGRKRVAQAFARRFDEIRTALDETEPAP